MAKAQFGYTTVLEDVDMAHGISTPRARSASVILCLPGVRRSNQGASVPSPSPYVAPLAAYRTREGNSRDQSA